MALIRSIATVGGYTMASRVLGFVRDVLIARVLGTGEMADAFFVAQRLPNLFRSLFAEGAFNAAFVPLFNRELAEGGHASAKRFAEQAMSVLLSVLLVFTIAAQIFMPWLMHVIAPGFTGRPAEFAMAVQFTQVTFPYLLFMSLTALQGGVLNSLNRFAHAAAAPIMLNVTMILALVVVAPATGLTGLALSWAIAIAGIIQFLWMVIACHRAGMALRLPWPRLTPGVKRLLKLMLPGIMGSSVMQVNLLIGTMIATNQPAAVSYLYYADRIYQLPLAVIGSAVGVVLLPELARALRTKGEAAASAIQNRSIEYALLLTLPATVALIAIPDPIVNVLYLRGAFGMTAAVATSWALVCYTLGLPAYVLAKALTPGFFAREDTRTPFRLAMISLGCNIAAVDHPVPIPELCRHRAGDRARLLAQCRDAELDAASPRPSQHRSPARPQSAQGAVLQPGHGGGAQGRCLGAGAGLRRISPGKDRRAHAAGRRRAGYLLRPGAGDQGRQRRRAQADAEARLKAE